MAGSTDEKLRSELQSLRIEPGDRARKNGSRASRLWAVGAIALAGVAGVVTWRAAHRAESVQVGYATVAQPGTTGPVAGLSGSGYVVTGDRYVSVGVRVPGRIEKYFIEEGQSVSRDDPLVQLDDRDYRAALKSAKASLAVARANLALAEAELRRGDALQADQVLSSQEFDVLQNRAAVARATLAQLEAQVEQAQVNLEYTTLRAPTDGVILAKLKEVGEIAVPGGFAGSGDLVRLANLNDMRAEVDVNEADLNRVRLGGPALVAPDAYPDATYDATVVKLYPQVNRQKGTLKVEVRINEPDAKLLPDMSARVTFLAEEPEAGRADAAPAVWIPSSAVRTEDGDTFVWRVESGTARRVPIEVGGRAEGRTRVKKGLGGGEELVTSPTDLSDGQAISPASS